MSIDEFWTEYLIKNNLDIDTKYNNEIYVSDEILNLILSGDKKAKAMPLNLYENKEDIPCEGNLAIVLDSKGLPHCIIETNKVRIILFKNINYDIVKLFGEEKNLLSWQKNKIDEFTKIMNDKNLKFTPDTSIVIEEFEVIYKKD